MKNMEALNRQLSKFVHSKPHVLRHGTQKRLLTREEILALTDAGVAFIEGKYQSAIVQYKKCLLLNTKYSDNDNEPTKLTVVVSYLISKCLLHSNEFQDLLEARTILTELEETVGDIYPMIYYGFAKLLTTLYCFNDAEKIIIKGFGIINDETYLQDLNIPQHDDIIAESQIKTLTELLSDLKKTVDSWHPPDAKCIMSNCNETQSQNHLTGKNIYFNSPAFNGFIKVICNNIHYPCKMIFHIACWKNKKDMLSPDKKLSDKDMLSWNCLTPNCKFYNKPCLINKICVYGDDANLKSVTETTIDKLHWQPHHHHNQNHQQQQQQHQQNVSKGAIRKQPQQQKTKNHNNNNNSQKTIKGHKQLSTTINKQKPDDNNNNNNEEEKNNNIGITVEVPLTTNSWNYFKKNLEKEKNIEIKENQENENTTIQKNESNNVSDDNDDDLLYHDTEQHSKKEEEEKEAEEKKEEEEEEETIEEEILDNVSDSEKIKSFIYTWFIECLTESGPMKDDDLMGRWQEAMSLIGDSAELLSEYDNVDKVKRFLSNKTTGIVVQLNLHEQPICNGKKTPVDEELQTSLINKQTNFDLNNNDESNQIVSNEKKTNVLTNGHKFTKSHVLIHEFLPNESMTADKDTQVNIQNNETNMLNNKINRLNRELSSCRQELLITKRKLYNEKMNNLQYTIHNEYTDKKTYIKEKLKKYNDECSIIEKLLDIEKNIFGSNDESLIDRALWIDSIKKIHQISTKLDSDYADLYAQLKLDNTFEKNKKYVRLNIQGMNDLIHQNIPELIQNIFDKCYDEIDRKYQLMMEQKSTQLSRVINQQVWYPTSQRQPVPGLWGINPPEIIPSQNHQAHPQWIRWTNNSPTYPQIVSPSETRYLKQVTPPPPPPSPLPFVKQQPSSSSSSYSQSYYTPPFQYYPKPPCPVHFPTIRSTIDASCSPIKSTTTKPIVTDPLNGEEIKQDELTIVTPTKLSPLSSPFQHSPPDWVKNVTDKYLNGLEDSEIETLKNNCINNDPMPSIQDVAENNKAVAAMLVDGIIKRLLGNNNNNNNTQGIINEENIPNDDNNNNNITCSNDDEHNELQENKNKSHALSLSSSNEHVIKESTDDTGKPNGFISINSCSQSSVSSINGDSSYVKSYGHEYCNDTIEPTSANSISPHDDEIIENNYITCDKLLKILCDEHPDILECDIKSALDVVRDSYDGSLTGVSLNSIVLEVDQVIHQRKELQIINYDNDNNDNGNEEDDDDDDDDDSDEEEEEDDDDDDNEDDEDGDDEEEDEDEEEISNYYKNSTRRYSPVKLVASDLAESASSINGDYKPECLWDMGPPSSLVKINKKQITDDEIKKRLDELRKTKPLGDYFWDIDEPSTFASVVTSSLKKQNTLNTSINQPSTSINQPSTSISQPSTSTNTNFNSEIEQEEKQQQQQFQESNLSWRNRSSSPPPRKFSSYSSPSRWSIPPRFQRIVDEKKRESLARDKNKPSSGEKLLNYLRTKYPLRLEYDFHVAIAAVRKNYNGSLSGKLFSKIIRDVERNLVHREKAQLDDYSSTGQSALLSSQKQRTNSFKSSASTEPIPSLFSLPSSQKQRTNSLKSSTSTEPIPSLLSLPLPPPTTSAAAAVASTSATASATATPRREYHAIMNPWRKPKEVDVKIITGECPICMEEFTSEKNDVCELAPCLHTFHRHCIEYWYKHNKTCPTCRLNSALDEFPPLA
ncbi:hypothetical protein HCN44_003851 [Aphidius gifuensis]|uniref:RING-type domain-containing protein n=1 Tax=Aphidius gifuensis TaxID=684658 RepID=A0A835CRX7_APHGI|nr:hypothetical protein HCN44_003851 [Aphidius gifuensis]